MLYSPYLYLSINIVMPRLSLYKPHKSKDYEFLDNIIREQFTVGGTDIHIHKYIGTDDGETAKDHTQIQDMMFLENRDRKYDEDIYTTRGIYSVQDIDFDLSQFGLFLSNDTIFLTIHINSSVKTLGRKIMSGDVVEFPHLKDEYAENDFNVALKRYYVVEDVNRSAEGFSQTWYPHLYRVKLKQIYDGQEYKDILDLPAEEGQDTSLRDLLSTYEKEMQINNAVVNEATEELQQSGYDTTSYFTLSTDESGDVELSSTTDSDGLSEMTPPDRPGYNGYLVGTALPPNGETVFGHGISFPGDAEANDYFLRTDFMPNRLFKYVNGRWNKVQDVQRADLYGSNTTNNQKGSFINNDSATTTVAGETFKEKQGLSQALRPKADN
jgi:hypothetical protein